MTSDDKVILAIAWRFLAMLVLSVGVTLWVGGWPGMLVGLGLFMLLGSVLL